MNISYCERWWQSRLEPLGTLTESKAEELHDARKPYVAIIGSPDSPRFVVDIAAPWISVDFFDDKHRRYVSYTFRETNECRLFLSEAIHWQFDGKNSEAISKKIFKFEQNGFVTVSEASPPSDAGTQFDLIAATDENWAQYPDFGKYDHLCVAERAST